MHPFPSLLAGGGFALWTFNPADANLTNAALSNNNRTYTSSTTVQGLARGTAWGSGKWYYEAAMGVGVGCQLGYANATASQSDYVGSSVNGVAYQNNGVLAYNGGTLANYSTWVPGDVIALAIDTANNKAWWAKNNVWQGSGNPATNVGGVALNTVAGTLYPAASVYGAGVYVRIQLIYDPPSGFLPARS